MNNPAAEANLKDRWGELATFVQMGSWRSVLSSVGQIVEGLIKHRLAASGVPNTQGKTLGQLLHLASQQGILQSSPSARLVDTTLSAVVILRNWASHYNEFHKTPDALQGGQALVLLLAASEALFPTVQLRHNFAIKDIERLTIERILEHKNPHTSAILIQRLSNEEQVAILSENLPALAVHFAQYGSPGAIAQLETLLRRQSLPTHPLRDPIAANFPAIIRNASRSSFRKLKEMLLVLRRLGLDTHSSAAGILLPADAAFLARLMATRPPAYVALYLMECSKANRGALSSRFGKPERRLPFISSFWSVFATGTEDITNAASILQRLPMFMRADIMERAPKKALLRWMELSDPEDSIKLLALLRSSVVDMKPKLLSLRSEMIETIARSIGKAKPASLSRLPLMLHKLEPVDTSGYSAILKACLQRAGSIKNWQAVRRVIWDVYCFHPAMRDEGVEAASRIVTAAPLSIPIWERMCLLGLLALGNSLQLEPESCVTQDDHRDLPPFLPAETDRWQGFLFAVGVAHAATPDFIRRLPPSLLDSIGERLSGTATQNDASALLMKGAETALAKLLKAPSLDDRAASTRSS